MPSGIHSLGCNGLRKRKALVKWVEEAGFAKKPWNSRTASQTEAPPQRLERTKGSRKTKQKGRYTLYVEDTLTSNPKTLNAVARIHNEPGPA